MKTFNLLTTLSCYIFRFNVNKIKTALTLQHFFMYLFASICVQRCTVFWIKTHLLWSHIGVTVLVCVLSYQVITDGLTKYQIPPLLVYLVHYQILVILKITFTNISDILEYGEYMKIKIEVTFSNSICLSSDLMVDQYIILMQSSCHVK